jgi:hypothetical protein
MILPLNPEQEKQFKKLKAAYAACQKAGVYFVNNYGMLLAYDSNLVAAYTDKRSDDAFQADDVYTPNRFRIANEWADDTHYVRLTPQGLAYKKQQEDEDQ